MRRDVEEGWVTRERATDVYGVVLADDGTVDAEATRRRRGDLARAAARTGETT